jgi:hypothetical protein
MKSLTGIMAATVLALICARHAMFFAQAEPAAAVAACAPMGGLHFVCGADNPEDLAPIPDTRWLIASGLKAGAGLKLIDTEAKTARPFYTGANAQKRPDKGLYPNCPAPPEVKSFRAHGIYLRRMAAPRSYRLYAVSHGALESIQVFDVDANGLEPNLAWIGCVPMPAGNKAYPNLGQATAARIEANAVAAYSDGTIIATIPQRPGTTNLQRLGGEPTGDVVAWTPGTESFHVLPGTQLAGNNGIEISPDESEFYVVSFGTATVFVFSSKDTRKPLRRGAAPGFMPDNLRWSGDRLIAAGSMYDEPACGGTRFAIASNPILTSCHRGYMVAQLDPKAMTWTVLAYGEPNPELAVVATGVVLGDTLWLGAASAGGVAYRPLPRPVNR